MHFGPEAHGARSGGLYMDKELGSDLLEPHLMALYGQIYKSVKTIINKPMYTGYSIPFGYFEGFRTVLATTHVVAYATKKKKLLQNLKSWDMNYIYYGGVNCESAPFLGKTNSIKIEVQCGEEVESSSLRSVLSLFFELTLMRASHIHKLVQ